MFLQSSIYYWIFQQQGSHKNMWEVFLQKQDQDRNFPYFFSLTLVQGSQDINDTPHSLTFPLTHFRQLML